MADEKENEPLHVDAFPTKRFFVGMLTRDIELDDAVLDLLDNCLDGVLRSLKAKGASVESESAYDGYRATITFTGSSFTIEDNCGGIPRDVAMEYAFRMGAPADSKRLKLPTVGIYGIGMKRSIFKMGRKATVTSYTPSDAFEVEIPEDWEADETNWQFPLKDVEGGKKAPGTRIHVSLLMPEVKARFGSDSAFATDLRNKISLHYSVIIDKGFSVKVNGEPVTPRQLRLLSDIVDGENTPHIAPYLYRNVIKGVNVNLAVGFYKPLPSPDEVEAAENARHTTDDAGWTVVCNDRVVLACDKTITTGWGDADVPSYHPQFIAIAGVVYFTSNDASLLPITTTKRGIEGGSTLYLKVKDHMRRGTKLFTSYTNRWKTKIEEEKKVRSQVKTVPADEVMRSIPEARWHKVRGGDPEERVFQPNLPVPAKSEDEQTIRFVKPRKEVVRLSKFLFETEDTKPSIVGAGCFDYVLKESRKK